MKTPDEIHACMEDIYQTMEEADIPWNRAAAPDILVDLVDSSAIQPCTALDIGSGTGNYSLYLASKGFQVTGVDVSQTAIQIANNKASELNSSARFVSLNMLDEEIELNSTFEFINEWMVLHHILPLSREVYLKNICRLLAPHGKYLSVSFSEADRQFGTPPEGRNRKSPLGPVIYCATLDELADFFAPEFHIVSKQLTKIPAKQGQHTVNYLLLEKR